MPDAASQLRSRRTSASEEDKPDRWQQRAGRGALVISGALVASCLLITRVRKLCVRLVAPERAKHATPDHLDKTLSSVWEGQRHSKAEVARLQEELAVLRKEYEEFRDHTHNIGGKRANIVGSLFENDTVQALYRIIPALYKGEHVKKIVRNVEGNYAKTSGRDRGFEIDAIVITAKRVFVIETKLTLKHKDVDRLVMLLENFRQLKFADKKLHTLMRSKPVHGGFSYNFDPKIEKEGERAKRVSKYAQQHKLLTIPRLLSDKSTPKQVYELRDFRRQR